MNIYLVDMYLVPRTSTSMVARVQVYPSTVCSRSVWESYHGTRVLEYSKSGRDKCHVSPAALYCNRQTPRLHPRSTCTRGACTLESYLQVHVYCLPLAETLCGSASHLSGVEERREASMWSAGLVAAVGASVDSAAGVWDLSPVLLPHATNFTMTIYGAPSDAADLAPFIEFMKENAIGEGFDPGPSVESSQDVFDLLQVGARARACVRAGFVCVRARQL